jgi:hypothetical protein
MGGLQMNERLKQLWNRSNYDEEVFAKLIVRECIDIAQDRANFPGFPPNDVNDIIDEIREHFGVDGMSIEDKKTLIKELLGVKNETN